MSFPENPLSQYRSYAYHHILIAADATTVVEAFKDGQIPTSSLQSGDSDGYRQVRSIPNQTGNYVVLINGMTDAEFSIDTVEWTSIITPDGSNGEDALTTMMSEGTMTIVEPKGISFLSLLHDTFTALNTDPTGTIFILKTIFIGNTDEFAPNVIDIKPLAFIMYDIQANFNEAGAEYSLTYTSAVNGGAKFPQILSATSGIRLSMGEKTTLENAIQQLETNIIGTYAAAVRDADNSDLLPFGELVKDNFRLINYKIILDDVYKTTDNEHPQYVIDDIDHGYQNSTAGTTTFVFDVDSTIETAINSIMSKSSQVQRDALGEDGKQKFMYKILSTVVSSSYSEGSTGNDSTMDFVYRIVRYPVLFIESSKFAEGDDLLKEEVKRSGNYMEFNYIYTGLNTDIIEFDMRMTMGLTFFETIKAISNTTSAKSYANSNNSQGSRVKSTSSINAHGVQRKLTPFFLSTPVPKPQVLTSKYKVEKQAYIDLINRHAALEGLEAKMVIHGHPYLLNDLIVTPNQLLNKTINIDSTSCFASWSTTPGLIKVNIQIPENSSHIFKAQNFWYQGFYRILQVKNSFNAGLFTQTIDMFSLPQKDDVPPVQTEAELAEQEQEDIKARLKEQSITTANQEPSNG